MQPSAELASGHSGLSQRLGPGWPAHCKAAFEKAVRLPRCALGDAPSGEDHSEVERGTALALSQELFATAFGAAAVAAGFEAHNQRCNFFTVPESRTGQTK